MEPWAAFARRRAMTILSCLMAASWVCLIVPIARRQCRQRETSHPRTGKMDDVRYVLCAIDVREQRHARPRDLVVVARDAEDADAGRRREILDCAPSGPCVSAATSKPVSDVDTAPQPISPKCLRMLCLSAAQIFLESSAGG